MAEGVGGAYSVLPCRTKWGGVTKEGGGWRASSTASSWYSSHSHAPVAGSAQNPVASCCSAVRVFARSRRSCGAQGVIRQPVISSDRPAVEETSSCLNCRSQLKQAGAARVALHLEDAHDRTAHHENEQAACSADACGGQTLLRSNPPVVPTEWSTARGGALRAAAALCANEGLLRRRRPARRCLGDMGESALGKSAPLWGQCPLQVPAIRARYTCPLQVVPAGRPQPSQQRTDNKQEEAQLDENVVR